MENVKNTKLEEGKLYSYKSICQIRGEGIVYGKSRQLQLKRWKREFDWYKYSPTLYHITTIYDEPKEVVDGRGGKRVGSGAKKKLDAEIQYIAEAFFYDAWKKNDYYQQGYMNIVYINNDEMMKYFGIYKDLYGAKKDILVDPKKFSLIADKLREKFRSLILKRIEAMPGITMSYGIIALKKKDGRRYIKDEWLEWWLQLQQEYFSNNGFRNERDVIIKGQWAEMNEYIRKKICDHEDVNYYSIKKFRKITFELDGLESYDYDQLIQYRKKINRQVIREVYSFFLEKEKILAIKEAENEELLELFTSDATSSVHKESDVEELLRLLDEYEETEKEVAFDEDVSMSEYVKILKNYILVS